MAVPLRVLILEDVPADAEPLVQGLRRAGFEPDWQRVETESDYLAYLDPAPDIILADYHLPSFDALRALQRLQERGLDIPLIVVTGTLGDEAAAECIKQGAADYLLKDRLARLGPAVARALEQRQLRSERKRAEAVVRFGEQELSDFVENAAVGMHWMGPDGKILWANRTELELLGYSREEYIGHHVAEFHADKGAIEDILGKLSANVTLHDYEARLLAKDGSIKHVLISSNVLFENGQFVHTRCFTHDITERKRAVETLQALYQASLQMQEPLELRKRLDRILEVARKVLELDRLNVLLADPAGEWLEAVASLGTEEPLKAIRVPIGPEGGGISQAYLTRRPIMWNGNGSVPEPIRLRPPYDQIAAFRSQVFVNVPLVTQGRAIGVLGADRKHSRRPFDASMLEPLQLFAGQAALAIEHGRLYEAQRMAAIQLEAMVEARTRDLQAANVQLEETSRVAEEASRHKSEFLTNISHELRTPLNSILGFSELLAQQGYGPLTEKQARHVTNIRTAGEHLLALINDLLDLSRVEAGKLDLRFQSFSLPESMVAVLSEIQPIGDAKSLTMKLRVDAAPAILSADPVRFKQILYNLLSNAVKFTPAGGCITVTACRVPSSEFGVSSSQPETRNPKPETASASDFVEIAVADTGIGIKPDDLPKLFQPFTQLEYIFTRPTQGAGLGLALTRRLVQLHGGTIRAESAGEGRGSTFTICLPLPSHAS